MSNCKDLIGFIKRFMTQAAPLWQLEQNSQGPHGMKGLNGERLSQRLVTNESIFTHASSGEREGQEQHGFSMHVISGGEGIREMERVHQTDYLPGA